MLIGLGAGLGQQGDQALDVRHVLLGARTVGEVIPEVLAGRPLEGDERTVAEVVRPRPHHGRHFVEEHAIAVHIQHQLRVACLGELLIDSGNEGALGRARAFLAAPATQLLDAFDRCRARVIEGVGTVRGDQILPLPAGRTKPHRSLAQHHSVAGAIRIVSGLAGINRGAGGGVEHRHLGGTQLGRQARRHVEPRIPKHRRGGDHVRLECGTPDHCGERQQQRQTGSSSIHFFLPKAGIRGCCRRECGSMPCRTYCRNFCCTKSRVNPKYHRRRPQKRMYCAQHEPGQPRRLWPIGVWGKLHAPCKTVSA